MGGGSGARALSCSSLPKLGPWGRGAGIPASIRVSKASGSTSTGKVTASPQSPARRGDINWDMGREHGAGGCHRGLGSDDPTLSRLWDQPGRLQIGEQQRWGEQELAAAQPGVAAARLRGLQPLLMAVPQFPLLGKGATLSPALCSEGKYEDLTSALVARSLAAVTPGLNASKYPSRARERVAACRALCRGSSPERGGGSFRLRALPKPRAAPGLHLASPAALFKHR